MCLNVVAAVWTDFSNNTICVPQFGLWVLDGYVNWSLRGSLEGSVHFGCSTLPSSACYPMLVFHILIVDQPFTGECSAMGWDGVLDWSAVELLRCSSARVSLSSSKEWPFQDVVINFFIDFTVASALPLLCG